MTLDAASIALQAIAYLALLQAAGGVMYLGSVGAPMRAGREAVVALIRRAAALGIAAALMHAAFEAGRMAGEFAGMADGRLQRLVWFGPAGEATVVRAAALTILAMRWNHGAARIGTVRTAAAVLAVLSLLTVGHTATNPARGVLAPLLALHLLVAAWWFGSLLPLACAARLEMPDTAGRCVHRFSVVAGWLVPCMAVAGLALAWLLTGGRFDGTQPYDLALLAKAAGFSSALALAALNRWRLAPALASGRPQAVRRFGLSLVVETVLLAAVVVVTAAMTSLFSPESA